MKYFATHSLSEVVKYAHVVPFRVTMRYTGLPQSLSARTHINTWLTNIKKLEMVAVWSGLGTKTTWVGLENIILWVHISV